MTKRIAIEGIDEFGINTLYNTKDYAQYVRCVENLLKGFCPFCPPIDKNLNKVLYENKRWFILESAFPQSHQTVHLLIVHRNHIGHVRDLKKKDWRDLGRINNWMNQHYDRKDELLGGGFALRFGDPKLNASSVPNHLHWNVQVPNGTDHVSVILCKSKEEIVLQEQRALVYEKIRLGTQYEDLSDKDKEIIKGRYPSLAT